MRAAFVPLVVLATTLAAAGCKPERTESIQLINAGLANEAAGSAELAYADYYRAATVDPENHRAFFHMALIELFDRDEPDKARAHLQQAWALAPDDRDVAYHLGRLEVASLEGDAPAKAGPAADPKAALGFLDAALALDPNHGPSHYHRGVALLALERFKDAEAALRESIACDPTNGMAFRDLGQLYERFQHDPAALAVYQAGSETATDRVDLFNGIGHLHLRARRSADAVAAFEKAQALNGNRVDTVFNLAFAHVENGAPRLAVQFLGDYLARADIKDAEHIAAARALKDALEGEIARQPPPAP
jgi:tetratricopeptide (TPR) repeat protein